MRPHHLYEYLFAAIVFLAMSLPTAAATFTVTTTDDAGAGSLRQAIADANASPGFDVVNFALSGCPCTIGVGSTLAITEEINLVGPGQSLLALDGGNAVQVISAGPFPILITDITVRNGRSPASGGGIGGQANVELNRVTLIGNTSAQFGGGVYSGATLVLADSTVTGNSAQSGGGAYAAVRALVDNSRFTANASTVDGGAIAAADAGVGSSIFDGNTAGSRGGGVFTNESASIGASSMINNSAAIAGGAVASTGGFLLTQTDLRNNVASGGGAVSNEVSGGGAVVDCTFDGNHAQGAGGGGAIRQTGNDGLSLSRVTFTANSSEGRGGAVQVGSVVSTLVRESLFAQNQSAAQGGGISVEGPLSVTRSRFLRNEAGFGGSASGGAVSATGLGTSDIRHSLFAGNFSSDPVGHAMAFGAGVDPMVIHATVANSGVRRAGTAVAASGTINVRNSILSDHQFGLRVITGGAAIATVSGILWWNNTFNTEGSGAVTFDVTGALSGDPLFVAPGTDDYHLAVGSPAVDSAPSPFDSIDIDGDFRPQGVASDLGYDERVRTPQSIAFGALPDRLLGDAPFSVTATASSGLAVEFSSTTTGTCTVAGSIVTLVATGTCTIAADQAGNAYYSVALRVTRSFGVTLATSIPRLANISTRVQVLTGDDVLIGGFIIGGTQPKTVVVRARGPSLAASGVSGALANPVLQLFAGATPIAANDDWGTAANAAALQASGYAPANVFESAILTTLGPGAYTAIVTGAGGLTGVGIVEVFEVDRPEVPLVNIATRGRVLTGSDVMIGGFIIQGDAPQTVVIRARGPSLVPFGIANALGDPVLQLFSGATPITSNDNWQTATNAAAIQASGFAPSNANESAILITLAPGAYTAIVTGAGNTTGVGIIEVFAQ